MEGVSGGAEAGGVEGLLTADTDLMELGVLVAERDLTGAGVVAVGVERSRSEFAEATLSLLAVTFIL